MNTPAATPAPPLIQDRWFRLLGIPAVSGLMMYVVSGPGWLNWVISLAYTVMLWEGNRALWLALLRRLPRLDQTTRRVALLVPAGVAYTLVASALLTAGLEWLDPAMPCGVTPCDSTMVWTTPFVNLVPGILVISIYESLHFFQQWKANLTRADQLARAGTQAQLDALHSQLDPHFLFNNLNTLAALITPGNAAAQQFVEQLADVYRYVLLAQGQPTVPLAEELAFVETYLALHKARFRDNLVVDVQVPPPALARRVAPLSVQTLVENALKHNAASRQHPLHLRLAVTAECPDVLLVENTLRPRTAGLAPGTGTGLPNVRRRYELLGAAQAVEAGPAGELFRVRLPLLPPQAGTDPSKPKGTQSEANFIKTNYPNASLKP